MIQLVFAHSNLNFGAEDGMPWPHISKDFENFKMRTSGTILVMGAKTFQSLPGLLPDRQHIVFYDGEREGELPVAQNGASAHNYIDVRLTKEFLERWKNIPDKIYSVIGGAKLLEEAEPYASRIVMTQIEQTTKPVTQMLSPGFIARVNTRKLQEMHYYNIPKHNTSIMELIF